MGLPVQLRGSARRDWFSHAISLSDSKCNAISIRCAKCKFPLCNAWLSIERTFGSLPPPPVCTFYLISNTRKCPSCAALLPEFSCCLHFIKFHLFNILNLGLYIQGLLELQLITTIHKLCIESKGRLKISLFLVA